MLIFFTTYMQSQCLSSYNAIYPRKQGFILQKTFSIKPLNPSIPSKWKDQFQLTNSIFLADKMVKPKLQLNNRLKITLSTN